MTAKFQQRHYETIARLIAGMLIAQAEREYIAKVFADELAADNARFDRSRFLKACGVFEEA